MSILTVYVATSSERRVHETAPLRCSHRIQIPLGPHAITHVRAAGGNNAVIYLPTTYHLPSSY